MTSKPTPDVTTIDRPLVEVTVSAPAELVWQALRDPAMIRQWFGWDADTLAGEIDFIFVEHAEPSDAERVLRFEGMGDRFEVEARGDTSLVRVVRPEPTATTDWDEIFEDMTQGWIAFVQQLKFALERHPGADRRTLYLSGSPKPASPALAAAALGLDPGWSPGDAYSVATPPGDRLSGNVWHRGRHQLGTTVRAWGDGLLVVMDRPPSDRWPTGGSQVILTTYGLADPELEALGTRWTAWWNQHFDKPAQATCE